MINVYLIFSILFSICISSSYCLLSDISSNICDNHHHNAAISNKYFQSFIYDSNVLINGKFVEKY